MTQQHLFGIDNQLNRLSDLGDQLETLAMVVDFEVFRPDLIMVLCRSDGSKGGRPAYDVVTMFKTLVIGAMITSKGYLAMGGQIVDATIVPAPKQRLKDEEKAQIKEGKSGDEIWDNPHKACHKDTDARWSIKYSKAKTEANGSKKVGHVDIAIPAFGDKKHIATDRRFGFIPGFKVSGASGYDGRYFRDVLRKDNTASDVWTDSAYRSPKNETWLDKNGFKSRIQQKKPMGRAMPERTRISNAKRSSIRSRVEDVFGEQKNRMGLYVKTIGIARAKIKIGMVNISYNMRCLIYQQRLNTS